MRSSDGAATSAGPHITPVSADLMERREKSTTNRETLVAVGYDPSGARVHLFDRDADPGESWWNS